MPIKLKCSCAKILVLKDDLAGKAVRCPACRQVVKVPSGQQPAENQAAHEIASSEQTTQPEQVQVPAGLQISEQPKSPLKFPRRPLTRRRSTHATRPRKSSNVILVTIIVVVLLLLSVVAFVVFNVIGIVHDVAGASHDIAKTVRGISVLVSESAPLKMVAADAFDVVICGDGKSYNTFMNLDKDQPRAAECYLTYGVDTQRIGEICVGLNFRKMFAAEGGVIVMIRGGYDEASYVRKIEADGYAREDSDGIRVWSKSHPNAKGKSCVAFVGNTLVGGFESDLKSVVKIAKGEGRSIYDDAMFISAYRKLRNQNLILIMKNSSSEGEASKTDQPKMQIAALGFAENDECVQEMAICFNDDSAANGWLKRFSEKVSNVKDVKFIGWNLEDACLYVCLRGKYEKMKKIN